MLEKILKIFELDISWEQLILYMFLSLILGGLIALIHMYKNQYTKNFIVTLMILPLLVNSTILAVNGNLGTGVAVMGAFGLVRFRSAQGNSRDMLSIFWAMVVGLTIGTNNIYYAIFISIFIVIVQLISFTKDFGEKKKENNLEREIKLTTEEAKFSLEKKLNKKYFEEINLISFEINQRKCTLIYHIKFIDKENENRFTNQILKHSAKIDVKISLLENKTNKIL